MMSNNEILYREILHTHIPLLWIQLCEMCDHSIKLSPIFFKTDLPQNFVTFNFSCLCHLHITLQSWSLKKSLSDLPARENPHKTTLTLLYSVVRSVHLGARLSLNECILTNKCFHCFKNITPEATR